MTTKSARLVERLEETAARVANGTIWGSAAPIILEAAARITEQDNEIALLRKALSAATEDALHKCIAKALGEREE